MAEFYISKFNNSVYLGEAVVQTWFPRVLFLHVCQACAQS